MKSETRFCEKGSKVELHVKRVWGNGFVTRLNSQLREMSHTTHGAVTQKKVE